MRHIWTIIEWDCDDYISLFPTDSFGFNNTDSFGFINTYSFGFINTKM